MRELEPPEGAETPSVWEHAGRGSPTQAGALGMLIFHGIFPGPQVKQMLIGSDFLLLTA